MLGGCGDVHPSAGVQAVKKGEVTPGFLDAPACPCAAPKVGVWALRKDTSGVGAGRRSDHVLIEVGQRFWIFLVHMFRGETAMDFKVWTTLQSVATISTGTQESVFVMLVNEWWMMRGRSFKSIVLWWFVVWWYAVDKDIGHLDIWILHNTGLKLIVHCVFMICFSIQHRSSWICFSSLAVWQWLEVSLVKLLTPGRFAQRARWKQE